jgi:hypothetical protein
VTITVDPPVVGVNQPPSILPGGAPNTPSPSISSSTPATLECTYLHLGRRV